MKKGKWAWVLAILAAGFCALGGCEHLGVKDEILKGVGSEFCDAVANSVAQYCDDIRQEDAYRQVFEPTDDPTVELDEPVNP